MQTPSIRDYVAVRSRPTVVRLDDLGAEWITSSFAVTQEVQTHLDVLAKVFAEDSGTAAFLIGHYGAGKTHFLAYLTETLQKGELLCGPTTPDVVTVSMLNFRSEASLEDVVLGEIGISSAADDRRQVFAEISKGHPNGLVLILDEVSEFLRSKPNPQAFNEDVRFMQFLGEWAQGNRFWLLAAMQEQIEHTGQLESALYRKIKDRFPLRLLLRPSHVRDLLRDGVLVQRPGTAEKVAELAQLVRRALPDSGLDERAFCELYPIHPATLELLEEVRDLFSQARGVVEFVLTQLEGDASRGLEAFLDRPWGELVTPDRIVDHFRDLFEVQPEFLSLAQTVLPYYERHGAALFDTEASHELAWRLLKLLMLCHISPQRNGLQVAEASAWLLFRPSSIAPEVNRKVVERILLRLANEGRFVTHNRDGFALDLRDDSAMRLAQMLEQQTAEIDALSEETLWELLAPLLDGESFNPFALPRDRWQRRNQRWHFHDRPVAVYFGNGAPPEIDAPGLCIRLPWGDAGAAAAPTLIPPRVELTAELVELAALVRVAETPGSGDVKRLAEQRVEAHGDLLGATLRNAYLQARVHVPEGRTQVHVRLARSTTNTQWLEGLCEWVLLRQYPSFERFAPAHGPLPKEAYRRLVRVATEHDLGSFEGDEYVKLVREAYLLPMGLMRREGWTYTQARNLDRHELVKIVMDMAQHRPPPSAIYERLAQPVYGLVDDQVHVLLLFLVLEGEVSLLKGRSSYHDMAETMPLPIQYDRVVPGSGLSAEKLRALEVLCKGIKVKTPSQWSVAGQRQAVKRVTAKLKPMLETLHGLRSRLENTRGGDELIAGLQRFLDRCVLLQQGGDELQGFELFIHETGSIESFLSELVAMEPLPRRIEGVLSELGRLNHLLAHPSLQGWPDPIVATRLEAVVVAPGLDRIDAVDEWLQLARSAYEAYVADYRKRHEEWRLSVAEDEIWKWEPPQLARSRHVGVDHQLSEFEKLKEKARSQSCRGLSDLAFQPRCGCGFDGRRGHVDVEMERLRELCESIDQGVRLFFQLDSVRDRMGQWRDQGLELNPETLEYLNNGRALPKVSDVGLFDRHFAGIEVVRSVSLAEIGKPLEGRAWSVPELVERVAKELEVFGDTRIRIGPEVGGGDSSELVQWCVEQSLRYGVALPRGLPPREGLSLDPAWISDAALSRLEDLGLGREIEDEVCRLLMQQQCVMGPGAQPSELVRACLEYVEPTSTPGVEELVKITRLLYGHHPRLAALGNRRWFERLEELTFADVGDEAPELVAVLKRHQEAQWLVVDCLGLVLLPELLRAIDVVLSAWRRADLAYASCSEKSTTDEFFLQLANAGLDHQLTKVNAVDRLLHDRPAPFADLSRLAAAELEVSLRRIRDELDPRRALVVFADHGFRLAPDGRSWVHGGPSTLERVVPIVELEPL